MSGNNRFLVAKEGKLAFKELGNSEVVGFVSCGGCPGKRAVSRDKLMVDRGAEVIAFSSCIFKGTPIGFACSHAEQMKNAISKKFGDTIQILDYTH